ncbi:MAG: alpha/beta fold hydrolase [Acidobacteriota bacterium]
MSDELHIEVHGSGRPLLLLAGLAMDVTLWFGLVPALAGHFQVIIHDPRGSGRTKAGFESLDTAVMADDALEVMNRLGIERAHVLGFSMGGMTAQVLAAKHPERIDRLVLASSAASMGSAGVLAMRLVVKLFSSRHCMAHSGAAMLPWLLGERGLKQQNVIDSLSRRKYVPTLAGFSAQCDALCSHDGQQLLSRITAPTLCISGDQDVLIPPVKARAMAKSLPDARFEDLPDCGHMCYLESLELFVRRVVNFLDAAPCSALKIHPFGL